MVIYAEGSVDGPIIVVDARRLGERANLDAIE